MEDRRTSKDRRGGEQYIGLPADEREASDRRQRETRRETDRIPVEIWFRNTFGLDGESFSLQPTGNLCVDGVQLRSPYGHEPDSRIHLEFKLPNSDRLFSCAGRVRSAEPDGEFCLLGVQFTELAPADRAALQAAVEELIGEHWFVDEG